MGCTPEGYTLRTMQQKQNKKKRKVDAVWLFPCFLLWCCEPYLCHNVLNSFVYMPQCYLCSFNVIYYSRKVFLRQSVVRSRSQCIQSEYMKDIYVNCG